MQHLNAPADAAWRGSAGPESSQRNGSLFVTGGSGFIGRYLLRSLASRAAEVTVLARSGAPREPDSGTSRVRWIAGDIADSGAYAAFLKSGDTVLHMAAATGKASAADHRRINVDGTAALVRAAAAAGVARFIFVSSIAARFEDVRSYPYARAKRTAEALVIRSGLPHLIVRPTIVLGAESPIWQRFRQLAAGRTIPLIGNGRTRIQPIHVRDAAAALVAVMHDDSATGVLELGGPDVLTIAELLTRIHRLSNTGNPRFVRIPYEPLRLVLSVLEPALHKRLPVTAGQLAVFVNDSTVTPTNRIMEMWPGMMSVDEMLKDLAAHA